MGQVDVEVRRAAGLDDYKACVELQKTVWTLATSEDMTSHLASTAILSLADRYGGNVLIAEDPKDVSGEIAGFAFAMLARPLAFEAPGQAGGRPQRNLMWWSHMTAVAPKYQNRNIGLQLKLRQRSEALREGVEQIQWTFDPLQALNAYFNIQKLGAIVRHYEENAYGTTTSALHYGLPTDRFVAEWHLDSARVRDRIGTRDRRAVRGDLDRISRINSPGNPVRLDLSDELLLLEIPSDLRKESAPGAWQSTLRMVCARYFDAGYVVTDFFRLNAPRDQSLYLLSRTSALE